MTPPFLILKRVAGKRLKTQNQFSHDIALNFI